MFDYILSCKITNFSLSVQIKNPFPSHKMTRNEILGRVSCFFLPLSAIFRNFALLSLLHFVGKMDELQTLSNLVQAEANAIATLPVTPRYSEALDLIQEQVCRKGGKLVASGMGKAGQIAFNIASTLASTGIPAVCINSAEAQHGDLGVLQPNDVLLLISNSGRTDEILRLYELARMLYPGMRAIVITAGAHCPLAAMPDVIGLYTGNPDEVCPLGLTPTTSITAMTVIGHMLIVGMMLRDGFTREQYAMRHRGGSLGEKLRGEQL